MATNVWFAEARCLPDDITLPRAESFCRLQRHPGDARGIAHDVAAVKWSSFSFLGMLFLNLDGQRKKKREKKKGRWDRLCKSWNDLLHVLHCLEIRRQGKQTFLSFCLVISMRSERDGQDGERGKSSRFSQEVGQWGCSSLNSEEKEKHVKSKTGTCLWFNTMPWDSILTALKKN